MVTFCSIAAPSNRAAARVLAEGLREHHPAARVWVRESDSAPAAIPRMLQDALRGGADAAVYIAPEACVYGPLDLALDTLAKSGVVLVRRVTSLPDDGRRPEPRELLRAGRISDALVAVSGSAEAERFLKWWTRSLELPDADHEPWLDSVPDLFPEAVVLDDTGYNVSLWNLHERTLAHRGEEIYAGGRKLRLMRFQGFRPDRPYWLSEDATRVRVVDDPVLAGVCGKYAEQLRHAGWIEPKREPDLGSSASDLAEPGSGLAVNVIGYLADTLGLAEAARLYVEGLTAAGIPVTTTAIRPDLPTDDRARSITRSGRQSYPERRAAVQPAFNLVCMNGDQLEAFVRLKGERALGGRPTIGQWAWETDVLPRSWLEAFRYVDEIWVNSTFVAKNLGRASPVPVVVVPQPIVVPDPAGVELDLVRDERFTFLFMFDYFSTLRRKNALGVVDAFSRAFAPGEGPRLLLKTINAPLRPKAAGELRLAVGGRQDIELVDGYLDPLEKTALLAGADCYVSLHRSEGFGLSLAESMALGTPVIATAYSGNTDFMTAQNSYLVDWSPTRVGPDCEIYPPDGVWAEPNLEHAAELMRRLFERPKEAETKARRARDDIASRYSPHVVGAVARSRLERLRDRRAAPRAASRTERESLQTVRDELAMDLLRGAAPAARGPAGLLRRFVLRLIFPFTYHERALDRALFHSILDLRTELERVREQSRQDCAAVRRMIDEELARGGHGE